MSPAHTLGIGTQIGSIEPGKLAGLIVLDGNPLDDIQNSSTVRYTMVNGRAPVSTGSCRTTTASTGMRLSRVKTTRDSRAIRCMITEAPAHWFARHATATGRPCIVDQRY